MEANSRFKVARVREHHFHLYFLVSLLTVGRSASVYSMVDPCGQKDSNMTTTDRKVRILCVEDDQQMRTFLQAQLKARNFQVQTVRDGAQAIDMAAIFEPQLVLLDLSLPTLDGLAFLRRLREWSRAPVIVLSAHDEEPVKIKALDQGADDYLTKPFSMNELLARVRVALRRADEVERLRSGMSSDMQSPVYRCGGDDGLTVDYA